MLSYFCNSKTKEEFYSIDINGNFPSTQKCKKQKYTLFILSILISILSMVLR